MSPEGEVQQQHGASSSPSPLHCSRVTSRDFPLPISSDADSVRSSPRSERLEVQSTSSGLNDPEARRLCYACGYDVRGIGSQVCPECGEPINWQRLVIPDNSRHQHGMEILRGENIGFRITDPHPVAPGIDGLQRASHQLNGAFWVPSHHAQMAIEALTRAKVFVPLPVVDIAEPLCPVCASVVEIGDEPPCHACGGVFQWIDVGHDSESRPGHRRSSRKVAPTESPTTANQPRRTSAVGVMLMVLCGGLAWIALQANAADVQSLSISMSLAAIASFAVGCWFLARR